MTIDQITDLAFEISSELQDDRFEEIIAFFEGIKRQQFGKIYERFDAPTFWKFYWGENEDDPNSYNFKKWIGFTWTPQGTSRKNLSSKVNLNKN